MHVSRAILGVLLELIGAAQRLSELGSVSKHGLMCVQVEARRIFLFSTRLLLVPVAIHSNAGGNLDEVNYGSNWVRLLVNIVRLDYYCLVDG